AADVIVQAHGRRTPGLRELTLQRYPKVLKDTYGGYYSLGRAFVKLIGNPKVMKLATERGLTHPILMKFTLKLLANLT
ncbi:FAD-dependent oxidoreductase, partial [Streptomyces sp. SID11233]|nr:FAD-dependent oxidoreductase [Streptomyces sp. SID11233]